jgi:3-oxoacyl-[acyl-carrier protein] reductase
LKNILLTGAGKGLGLEMASKFLDAGWNVYAIGRTKSTELCVLEEKHPGRLAFRSFDLVNCDGTTAMFKEFIPSTVVLDGFVNNAAQAYDDIVTNLNLESLEKMFKANVYSPFNLTKYAIRNMLFHRTLGSIVHVSSISVHTGYKGLSMYAASKGALEAFSKNTAREWGERGIRSNCIVAGFMETAMSASLSPEQKDRIYKRTSLKKPTDSSSVAAMCHFLLSDDSASVTGQNLFVDSGTI